MIEQITSTASAALCWSSNISTLLITSSVNYFQFDSKLIDNIFRSIPRLATDLP